MYKCKYDKADLRSGGKLQYQISSRITSPLTHDQPGILVIYRPLLGRLLNHPSVSNNSRVGYLTTYLVLEECVPDIIRHSGHNQNVTLAFLVSRNADTIAECGDPIPNWPEGAGRELARLWVGIDSDHPLEQLLPSLVLVVILKRIIAVL